MEKFYKIKDVAEVFSVTRQTIYNWIAEGKVNVIRINGNPRISEKEVERLKKGE